MYVRLQDESIDRSSVAFIVTLSDPDLVQIPVIGIYGVARHLKVGIRIFPWTAVVESFSPRIDVCYSLEGKVKDYDTIAFAVLDFFTIDVSTRFGNPLVIEWILTQHRHSVVFTFEHATAFNGTYINDVFTDTFSALYVVFFCNYRVVTCVDKSRTFRKVIVAAFRWNELRIAVNLTCSCIVRSKSDYFVIVTEAEFYGTVVKWILIKVVSVEIESDTNTVSVIPDYGVMEITAANHEITTWGICGTVAYYVTIDELVATFQRMINYSETFVVIDEGVDESICILCSIDFISRNCYAFVIVDSAVFHRWSEEFKIHIGVVLFLRHLNQWLVVTYFTMVYDSVVCEYLTCVILECWIRNHWTDSIQVSVFILRCVAWRRCSIDDGDTVGNGSYHGESIGHHRVGILTFYGSIDLNLVIVKYHVSDGSIVEQHCSRTHEMIESYTSTIIRHLAINRILTVKVSLRETSVCNSEAIP